MCIRDRYKYLDSLLLSQKVSQMVGQWDSKMGHFEAFRLTCRRQMAILTGKKFPNGCDQW